MNVNGVDERREGWLCHLDELASQYAEGDIVSWQTVNGRRIGQVQVVDGEKIIMTDARHSFRLIDIVETPSIRKETLRTVLR